jgi:predicted NAD-dependent protein-ADP-ribosyltransferase YbiA (DUF1768 family)
MLVEASPRDRVWGIGLAASDERAASLATWRGLNLDMALAQWVYQKTCAAGGGTVISGFFPASG